MDRSCLNRAFSDERHRTVYDAIGALNERAEPADVLTVERELEREGALARVGGVQNVSATTSSVPSRIDFRASVRRLVKRGADR